jgi:putative SOS response-associated peptidase YedK
MAGLWEEWKSSAGKAIKSCTIITTGANELIAPQTACR